MAMNELVTNNATTEINFKNEKLKTQVSKIVEATATATRSVWKYAEAISNIFSKDLWKDDFETQKDMATWLDISNGAVSQYVGAVKFRNEKGFKETDCSVQNAYLIGAIKKKAMDSEKGKMVTVSDSDGFIQWASDNGMNPYKLKLKDLRDKINEYKNERDGIVDTTAEEISSEVVEDSTESIENAENKLAVDTKEKALTAIASLVAQFNISFEELINNVNFDTPESVEGNDGEVE